MRIQPYTNTNIEQWNIIIGNYDVDTDLTINCNETISDLDLGGIPLSTCIVSIGGGNVDVDFATPTIGQVERLAISGYAMNLFLKNIGNTDFKTLNLIGIGNAIDLDFAGAYISSQHDTNILNPGTINKISVPNDTGEMVRFFSAGPPIVVVPTSEWITDWWLGYLQQYSTTDYDHSLIKLNLNITEFISFGAAVRQ